MALEISTMDRKKEALEKAAAFQHAQEKGGEISVSTRKNRVRDPFLPEQFEHIHNPGVNKWLSPRQVNNFCMIPEGIEITLHPVKGEFPGYPAPGRAPWTFTSAGGRELHEDLYFQLHTFSFT
jgi:hypothetical protein